MKYVLSNFYTEKLNVSNFPDFIENKDDIKLIINMNTNIVQLSSSEKKFIFRMNYEFLSENAPISLNWVGRCLIEFDEVPNKKLESKEFLKDSKILDFIDEAISNFSFFMGADLPKFSEMIGVKND